MPSFNSTISVCSVSSVIRFRLWSSVNLPEIAMQNLSQCLPDAAERYHADNRHPVCLWWFSMAPIPALFLQKSCWLSSSICISGRNSSLTSSHQSSSTGDGSKVWVTLLLTRATVIKWYALYAVGNLIWKLSLCVCICGVSYGIVLWIWPNSLQTRHAFSCQSFWVAALCPCWTQNVTHYEMFHAVVSAFLKVSPLVSLLLLWFE